MGDLNVSLSTPATSAWNDSSTDQDVSATPSGVSLAIARFQAYVVAIIVCVGVFGNLISIAIFTRNKKKDIASVQYLRVLAVVDSGVVLLVGLRNWLAKGLPFAIGSDVGFDPTVDYGIVCKLVRFVEQVCIFISSWIVVVFALERCVSVWLPLRALSTVTARRRYVILGILLVIGICSKVHILIYFDAFSPGGVYKNCWFPLDVAEATKIGLVCLNVILNRLLPCILIFAFNIGIISGVIHASPMAKRARSADGHACRKKQENRCIMNLIAISVIYFVFTMPACVTWMYYDILMYSDAGKNVPIQTLGTLFEIALLTDSVSLFNHGLNFICYGIMLDFYRRSLKQMLCFPFVRCGRYHTVTQSMSLTPTKQDGAENSSNEDHVED